MSRTTMMTTIMIIIMQSFPSKYRLLRMLSNTIDTEIKAKRNNMIFELISFRITKAKAKVKFGVEYLCERECERSSVPININTKAKATHYLGRINFTLIPVATVCVIVGSRQHGHESLCEYVN